MKIPGMCDHCGCPVHYAGCGERPAEERTPAVLEEGATGPFWVHCPKCGKSVPLEADAIAKEGEDALPPWAKNMGHLERTLRAWGVPYTPNRR